MEKQMQKQMQKQQIPKIIHLRIKLIRNLRINLIRKPSVRPRRTNTICVPRLSPPTTTKLDVGNFTFTAVLNLATPTNQRQCRRKKWKTRRKLFENGGKKLFRKRNGIFKEER